MTNGLVGLNLEDIRGRGIRIHPAWYSFIKYCEKLRFGEIERLKIQDGIPMIAEEVKRKIKFTEQE
jgi:hypothetical protein